MSDQIPNHEYFFKFYAFFPYQVYYSLWRRLLKLFWWLVVAYTMLVLISIYTYQFEDFPGYWRNFTGFTEEQYVFLLTFDSVQYCPLVSCFLFMIIVLLLYKKHL